MQLEISISVNNARHTFWENCSFSFNNKAWLSFELLLWYYDTVIADISLLLKINLDQLYHFNQFIFLAWYHIGFIYASLNSEEFFWKKRICDDNWNNTLFLRFIIHIRSQTNRRLILPEDVFFSVQTIMKGHRWFPTIWQLHLSENMCFHFNY